MDGGVGEVPTPNGSLGVMLRAFHHRLVLLGKPLPLFSVDLNCLEEAEAFLRMAVRISDSSAGMAIHGHR